MKIMLRAAVAVFSLGIGTAHAGDGDGHSATTLFTSIQNKQAAPALISVAAQPPTIAAQGRVPRSGVGTVGKWPAGATAKSLAQAGHLSTAVVIADLR